MSLHADLLDQAELLACTDRGRPRQANLRRAVSAAYYALFHFLIDQSTRLLLSGVHRAALRHPLARGFDHGQMARAARSFASSGPPKDPWRRAIGIPPSPALVDVASAFSDLQEARHEADYDLARSFTRGEVKSIVLRAHTAIADWATIAGEQEGDAFLVALLVKAGAE